MALSFIWIWMHFFSTKEKEASIAMDHNAMGRKSLRKVGLQ